SDHANFSARAGHFDRRMEIAASCLRIRLGRGSLAYRLDDECVSLCNFVALVEQLGEFGIDRQLDVLVTVGFSLDMPDRSRDRDAALNDMQAAFAIHMLPQLGVAPRGGHGLGGCAHFLGHAGLRLARTKPADLRSPQSYS